MIVTCPSCEAQYMINVAQISAKGRKVKCASCQYTWLQGPEELEVPEKNDSQQEDVTSIDQEDSNIVEADAEDVSSLSVEEIVSKLDADELPEREEVHSFAEDVQEVYGDRRFRSLSQEKTGMFSKGIFALSSVVSVLVCVGIGYGVAISDDAVFVKEVYQKIGLIEPELGAGLALNEVTADFAHVSGMNKLVISGRLDNQASHAVPLPNMLISATDRAGNIIKDWRVEPELMQMEKDQSIILDYSYTDAPSDIESVTIEFVADAEFE